MMDVRSAIEKLMKNIGGKLDDFIVESTTVTSAQLKFVNNRISSLRIDSGTSLSLFGAMDKRVASVQVERLDETSLRDVIKRFPKMIASSPKNKDYHGIAEGPFRYKEIMNIYDSAIEHQDLVDHAEAGINAALSAGAIRTSGVVERGLMETELITNHNVRAKQRRTHISFSIRAFADGEASGHALSCASSMQHFKPSQAGRRAGEFAVKSMGWKEGKEGKYDTILTPLAAAVFLERVGDAASIYDVESDMSFLKGRMNRRVASEHVSLFDDPHLPGGMGSSKFDAEGVPTKRNTIIKFGMLRTYLHNTSTARRHGVQTTANAGLVRPSPWNIVLDKGPYSLPEMIGEMRNGLLVTNTWYMRFHNYRTGEFSTVPRDAIFMIEKGEVKGAVRGLRISDNIRRVIEHIEMVGKRREQVLGWEVETPVKCGHIMVRGMRFTKG